MLRADRLLLLLVLLTGCAGLDQKYVAADKLTHEAIAPEYRRYVERDAGLDAAQKKRRLKTLEAWAARIEEAERALGKGDQQ